MTGNMIGRVFNNRYQITERIGIGGMAELKAQLHAIATGGKIETKVFPYQIAENLIPQIGSFNENGYTSEEMKMQNEGRKILHAPDLRVSCTCVRVPVVRSHSISITVVTEKPVSPLQAAEAISGASGLRLCDDPASLVYPMPLDTSDQDLVWVGRVRRDLVDEDAITLWCCGDQIRKGAAANAVQILRLLAEGKK